MVMRHGPQGQCKNIHPSTLFSFVHRAQKFCTGNDIFVLGMRIFLQVIPFCSDKGKVCIRAKWPISVRAYPGFSSMKRPAVLLLPPGWDASPPQGYPQP